ncbi:hypothetical protein COO20_11445 [Thalassospira marina]|uniref:Uncharacterized protein n=1 Tax=Thalassospira marina TaxID=2048283 RepID=A0A2N3KUC2_9PROT|nr:hypothetical protein COO20_11445 [Thalassospira marina]
MEWSVFCGFRNKVVFTSWKACGAEIPKLVLPVEITVLTEAGHWAYIKSVACPPGARNFGYAIRV